jgi:hypothetical protein
MKRSFKDVEHLIRLAAIFFAAVLVFAVARAELVPKDFGRYGHYRASAVDAAAAKPLSYAGRARCVECHEEDVVAKAAAGHKNIGCETCHGPLLKHADDPAVEVAKAEGPAQCLRCHLANTGKPAHQPTVVVKEHTDEPTCVSCHKAHDPRTDQE